MPAASSFINQTGPMAYAHTPTSQAYASSSGLFFQMMYDEFMVPMARFHTYLDSHGGPIEPTTVTHNPYTWAHDMEGKPFWEVMMSFPDRMSVFNASMATQDRVLDFMDIYDFRQLVSTNSSDSNKPVFVDVGGGYGQAIKSILAAYPGEFKAEQMTLQDLPHVIADVKKANELPQGVQIMIHDFFAEQPIKGARAYFIRRCLHDWPDNSAVKILARLAEACDLEHSRVLIGEIVVPAKCGPAEAAAAWMDMCMMEMGGKERTERNWREVLKEAGLEIEQIHYAAAGPQCVIEAKKV